MKQKPRTHLQDQKPDLEHQHQTTQFEGKNGTLLLLKSITNLSNLVKEITSFTKILESQKLDEKRKRKVTYTRCYASALFIKPVLKISISSQTNITNF